MADSIRDQLLGLGFKPAPKPERQDKPARPPGHAHGKPHSPGKPQQHGERPSPGQPRPHGRPQPHGRSQHGKPAEARPKPRGEMDLAKAYAIRAQKEKDERIAAEQARQAEAAKRREGKAKLAELLKTASLNVAEAEIARHFEYGGKIRRVYVTAEQLKAINAGELAVVQHGGRYHVLSLEQAKVAETLLPGALALLADPDAPAAEDPYADPKYQVPDDLIW
jgi:uncharacterized protein YaiL (DUF2058 family)